MASFHHAGPLLLPAACCTICSYSRISAALRPAFVSCPCATPHMADNPASNTPSKTVALLMGRRLLAPVESTKEPDVFALSKCRIEIGRGESYIPRVES